MSVAKISAVLLSMKAASALYITTPSTPASTTESLARRAEDTALPTFTLGSKLKYIPQRVSNPEPTGNRIQIYPTGTYEEFPASGIAIAFGPDLRKQITNAIEQSCKEKSHDDCRKALVPLLQETDVATHVKRFIVIGTIVFGLFLAAMVSEVLIFIGIIDSVGLHKVKDIPKEIKFSHNDLVQIHSIAGASTFAMVSGSATPSTITYQPPVTTTDSVLATIETLTADKDNRKAGDVVYHIPKHAAERIQDFLGMTGLQETQAICKDQMLKRADNLQECLRRVQRHAADLVDVGPSNLLQLARQNIPARPGNGQAIGFPIQNLAVNGVLIVIPVYHIIHEHAQQDPVQDNGWDAAVLAKSAMAVTIAAHAAMFAGQSLLHVWVEKDKIVTDLKEDDLACPKDVFCVVESCQGQAEGKDVQAMTPICTTSQNYGCVCKVVLYPHMLEVPNDYMQLQYAFLEQLIGRIDLPPLDPDCSEGEQNLLYPILQFTEVIEQACKEHSALTDSWEYEAKKGDLTFTIWFTKNENGGNCPFSCKDVFQNFAESDTCVSDSGVQKNGNILQKCGTAQYIAKQG